MTERRRSSFIALRPHRAVALERGCSLGIRKRESVAADMNFTILTCRCVVAQDDRGTGLAAAFAPTNNPTIRRGFLSPGTSVPVTRAGFRLGIRRNYPEVARENYDN